MVVICGFRNYAEIFTTIVNGWRSLPVVLKSSVLDTGRVFESTASRKWNTASDLKLKFTMLSIIYLKRNGQHQLLERVSTDEKLWNILHFNSKRHQKSSFRRVVSQLLAEYRAIWKSIMFSFSYDELNVVLAIHFSCRCLNFR